MKRNMARAMERMEIDPEIRPLIQQLWKHEYRTEFSCSGHGIDDNFYVGIKGNGDGWLESNLREMGLFKYQNNDCCQIVGDDSHFCNECGAGVHGYQMYKAVPQKAGNIGIMILPDNSIFGSSLLTSRN